MAGIDFAVYITPELVAGVERKGATEPKVIHRAATRGYLNEGWLQSYHTFSYTGYYHPDRMSFGKLRVLNQDTIAPGAGFPSFRTENMEMLYIPLEGAMQYYDALGNSSVVRRGEALLVSAGTGMMHSSYNANRDHVLKFLQLWIYPRTKTTEPRHCKFKTDTGAMMNNLVEIVTPDAADGKAGMNQDAWISAGRLAKDYEFRYRIHSKRSGVYIFLIRGEAVINGDQLRTHDGIGLWNTRCVDIKATTSAEVLVIEVPMV